MGFICEEMAITRDHLVAQAGDNNEEALEAIPAPSFTGSAFGLGYTSSIHIDKDLETADGMALSLLVISSISHP